VGTKDGTNRGPALAARYSEAFTAYLEDRGEQALGAAFIVLALRLQRRADRRSALRTYLFSLAYLAALFAVMVLDARI
jgi:heme O synthase-like polyprenyltransferase